MDDTETVDVEGHVCKGARSIDVTCMVPMGNQRRASRPMLLEARPPRYPQIPRFPRTHATCVRRGTSRGVSPSSSCLNYPSNSPSSRQVSPVSQTKWNASQCCHVTLSHNDKPFRGTPETHSSCATTMVGSFATTLAGVTPASRAASHVSRASRRRVYNPSARVVGATAVAPLPKRSGGGNVCATGHTGVSLRTRGVLLRGDTAQTTNRRVTVIPFSTAAGASGSAFNEDEEDVQSVDASAPANSIAGAVWKFVRPHTIRGTILGTTAIVTKCLLNNPELFSIALFPKALLGLVALLCGNGYIVGINQIYDVDIDKVNKPFLPIAAGELSVPLAWTACAVFVSLGATIVTVNFGTLITKLYLFGLFLGTVYRCVFSIDHVPPP